MILSRGVKQLLKLFKINVCLSQMSLKAVQYSFGPAAVTTSVSIAAVGLADDKCPCVGRAQLTTIFLADCLKRTTI